jgi:hypothetical protein
MGNMFIYSLDKETVIAKRPTSPLVLKYLNPNLSLNLNSKELKSKADNLATYINKDILYSSELGKFYLAKNPKYSINAKSSIIIINLKNYVGTICNSKRECARILSENLNKNIQLGTISRNNWLDIGVIIIKNEQEKFILLSKSFLISLISVPDSSLKDINSNRNDISNSISIAESYNIEKRFNTESLNLKEYAQHIDNFIMSFR